MKRKSGKPHAKALHQPIPELVKAESIPERKRTAGYNVHKKPRRETVADYFPSLRVATKTRRQMSDAEYKKCVRDLALGEMDEADGEKPPPPGLPLPEEEHETQRRSQTAATVLASYPTTKNTMDEDPDLTALREEIERHFDSAVPLEVIYFGGGLPGARRLITPFRYCEQRGNNYIIARCHRSGIEKTFRLDRMHLPGPPLADGRNDFQIIAKCIDNPRFIDGMLAQIARLGNLPMEQALAKHFDQHGEFESFFDEYSYGGYILVLKITTSVIYLSLGYDANDLELMHYEFTPESEPRLTPSIATHYSLYADWHRVSQI